MGAGETGFIFMFYDPTTQNPITTSSLFVISELFTCRTRMLWGL